jgi:hypothetical protein
MDALFGHCLRKGNIDAAVANPFDEEIGIADIDDQPYEESVLGHVADQLYFESINAIDDVLSPLKNHNDLSRFQNNITTYVSPMTKHLNDDIEENSPSRIRHHNAESLRASRKNMISIIDYIISIGDIEEDPQSAFLFDKMEKSLQKFKLELQQRTISQSKTPPCKGMIEFPAFNGPKKKTEPRLKGFGG